MSKATYPGMSLGGEVRESISLDEDELSDVEDEVFIRDGKNSYKLAEELNVKRPLMAPRRKLPKPDLTSRLRARPPCRAFCKPCCYIFVALSVLIGLITLVVILVSIFPLPLDRLRDWVVSRSPPPRPPPPRLLPCSRLRLTDVWTASLPLLATDSPVRTLDLDGDGVLDVVFGFGTAGNYDVLPSSIFCPVFLGVSPPCEGGVIALNGSDGGILWRYWLNDTVFSVQCSADLNEDGLLDCLAVGVEGTLAALNGKDGSPLWTRNDSKMDIFVGDFIPDQNNDSVPDVICSHTSRTAGGEGHLVLISGRTGEELRRVRTPNGAKTFFMPQMVQLNGSQYLLFGTGSPRSPGNLSITSTETVLHGNFSARTVYEDRHKGVFTQSVLVDLTGDNVSDIVTAMYNSTVVAVDGRSLRQLWNFTVAGAESNVVPTPAYFNADNVTDFLVVYERRDDLVDQNYTQAYILDGATGRPIYRKALSGVAASQMAALTLAMEGAGFDMFLFWTLECANVDMYRDRVGARDSNLESDVCRRQFNTSSIVRLNALNQYDQPPGFEVYNSVNRTGLEFGNVKSPLKRIREYLMKHPNIQLQGQSEVDEGYVDDSRNIKVHKYGSSSFRHKDNRQGIIKDYSNNDNSEMNDGLEADYEWRQPGLLDEEADLPNYPLDLDESDPSMFSNQQQMLYKQPVPKSGGRGPRSRQQNDTVAVGSRKRNLSTAKYGVYDYKNIKMAKNRLLHDLNNLPSEILRDTFLKNRESQLRRSKFEQRDITSHLDKRKQKEELRGLMEEERRAAENASLNLWDLESEKELVDKENGYWRGKREANYTLAGVRTVSSVGALVKSLDATNNSIDVIFITYWLPDKVQDRESLLKDEVKDCVEEKLANGSENQAHSYQKTTEQEQRDLFANECMREQEDLKSEFSYFNEINQLRLGQMTVYRVRVECLCDVQKSGERCAKFLPQDEQSWSMYLGKYGNGIFDTRN